MMLCFGDPAKQSVPHEQPTTLLKTFLSVAGMCANLDICREKDVVIWVFLCKLSLLGTVIMFCTFFCLNIVFPVIYLAVSEKFLNNKKTPR